MRYLVRRGREFGRGAASELSAENRYGTGAGPSRAGAKGGTIMGNEHALLLAVWLGTGGAGLIMGLIAVRVAKRRLVRTASAGRDPSGADDELIAA